MQRQAAMARQRAWEEEQRLWQAEQRALEVARREDLAAREREDARERERQARARRLEVMLAVTGAVTLPFALLSSLMGMNVQGALPFATFGQVLTAGALAAVLVGGAVLALLAWSRR